MATYVNDLRLKEIATGDEAGTWGTSTNTNLELIAEAFSFGTEAITTNADTHTTTIADGSTDPGRSMFLKYTGTLDSTCTITIGPNTVSKLWFIENATSGSQSIIIKQGSGATITILNGQTKAIYSDGAGSGGAMVDAFTDLSVPSFFVSGDLDVDGTTNLDVVDIDGAVDFASTTTHAGNASFADNAKAIFGAGSDLQIFHDGSTSIITDQGTGFLALRGDGNVSLQSADGTENKLVASTDGAVTLYHDNSAKLATTSTGVDVTGTVTADGLTVDGTSALGGAVTITETGTGSSAGPFLNLHRDSSSPADSDLIGIIQFQGEDDGSNVTAYGTIAGKIADVTGGTEDGVLLFNVIAAGSSLDALTLSHNEAVFNNGSADYDFRVESDDNTHMLFLDGNDNRVYVGGSTNVNTSALQVTSQAAQSAIVTKVIDNAYSIFQGFDASNNLLTQITGAGVLTHNGAANFNEGGADNDFRVESSGNTGMLFVDASADRVGIGTVSPVADLSVGSVASGTSTSTPVELNLGSTFADSAGSLSKAKFKLFEDSSANVYGLSVSSGFMEFGVPSSAGYAFFVNESEKMRIASGGYVNPKANVATINAPDTQGLHFGWNYSNGAGESLIVFNKGAGTTGGLTFVDNSSSGTHDEVMRIESGTLLVGKTADDNSVGFKTNTNSTYMVASGQTPTFINRLSSAGDLLEFRKDSSTKGRIGTDGTDIFIGSDDTNLLFHASGVLPANSVGGLRDNAFALGSASGRFSDLRLAGIMYSGTARINTTTSNSDARVNIKAASNAIQVVFQNSSGTTIGYIGNVSDSSTLYSTSSDERLKENITNADDSGSKIDAIQVRQFDWKVNGLHQDYGMVAQELQSVAPEAVAAPEDPNDMMGVDYSKLVPMLIKEVQSLRARVAQLETEE